MLSNVRAKPCMGLEADKVRVRLASRRLLGYWDRSVDAGVYKWRPKRD